MSRFAPIIVLILTPVLLLTTAHAATYTVNPDGSGDYATIQAAIEAVVNGDIIQLGDGTFTGSGNHNIDFMGKAITVASLSGDATACIIDCEGTVASPSTGFIFQNDETAAAVLQQVTVTNGYTATWGSAVYIDGTSPTISGCIFTGNTSNVGGAVYCGEPTALPTISSCTISHNVADSGGGMYVHEASPSITGCMIFGNSAGTGGGVFCYGSSCAAAFSTCTLVGNWATTSGGGMECYDAFPTLDNTIIAFTAGGAANSGAGPTLSCCNIYGNIGGDWVGGIADQQLLNDNISLDPQFCDPTNDDFTLHSTSPCAAGSAPNPACTQIGAGAVVCGAASTPHACCAGDSCYLITEEECLYLGGDWHAGWDTCTPNPCPEPQGVCCLSGVCQITTQSHCTTTLGGDWLVGESSCTPNPCPQPNTAACCIGAVCTITTQTACTSGGGTWLESVTSCDPNPCGVSNIAACCIFDVCLDLTEVECAAQGGSWHPGYECAGNDCLELVACCFDQECRLMWAAECTDQAGELADPQTGACDPNPCMTPVNSATWGVIKARFRSGRASDSR
jgi:hypothetical protein